MGSAKLLKIQPIDSATSRRFIERVHYSKKSQSNAFLHMGVFWQGKLEGCIMFGPPMHRRNTLASMPGLHWNGVIEINRMAFTDALPRNSESRALGFAMRLLRKKRPDIKVVISFSDATQCGDGTIYRAANFKLTQIRPNASIWRLPHGECVATMAIASGQRLRRRLLSQYNMIDKGCSGAKLLKAMGGVAVQGYQLRYMYFLCSKFEAASGIQILPFSAIDAVGAGMYKGIRRATSIGNDAASFQLAEGGANPTVALQSNSSGMVAADA